MSNKKILLLALFFGLMTALAMHWYLQRVENAVSNVTMKKVLVANMKIPARSVLSSDMLSFKEIPVDFVHPDALTDQEQAVGFVTNTDISAGEQLLGDKLIQKTGRPVGLSFVIPLGTRAMSIPVTEITGVGGLIKPGDRVDVIGTIELELLNQVGAVQSAASAGAPTRTKVAHVLLQNIEVLAVGSDMSVSTSKPAAEAKEAANQAASAAKNITLAVPVEKLQALTLMLDHGRVTLALRSPLDESKYERNPFDDSQFLKK